MVISNCNPIYLQFSPPIESFEIFDLFILRLITGNWLVKIWLSARTARWSIIMFLPVLIHPHRDL